MKQIFRVLRPLKNRMHADNAMKFLVYAFIFAGAVNLILSCISLLAPVSFLLSKIVYIYAASFAGVFILTLFLRPNNIKVMKKADTLGARERLITAYELRNDTSAIAIMQRSDAYNIARKMDWRNLYPIRIPFEYSLLGILLLFFLLGTFFIPSPSREKAIAFENFTTELKKQESAIESERLKLSGMGNVDRNLLDKINARLSELKKKLLRSRNEEDAMKTILEAKNELMQLKRDMSGSELGDVAENLKDDPLTQDLADAMKSGDVNRMKNELDKLKNRQNDMSASEKNKLSEQFKKAADQVKMNNQLKQNLNALSQTLAAGDNTLSGQQLSNLGSNLSDPLQSMNSEEEKQVDHILNSLNEAKNHLSDMQDYNEQLAESQNPEESQENRNTGNSNGSKEGQANNKSDSTSQLASSSDMQNPSGQSNSNNSQYAQSSSAESDSDNTKSAQSSSAESDSDNVKSAQSQPGQSDSSSFNSENAANSQFQEMRGSNSPLAQSQNSVKEQMAEVGKNSSSGGGAGTGSPSGDSSKGLPESSGPILAGSDKNVREYESIYVPSRLGGDAQVSQVKGSIGKSGQSSLIKAQNAPPADMGTAMPYDKVFGTYKSEAMTSIQGDSIPEGMKDLVREYFSSLE